MSYDEERRENKPVSMVAPLGTNPLKEAIGEFSDAKFTYLVSSDRLPDQFKLLLYRMVRRDVVIKKLRFDDALTTNMILLLNAINGRSQELLLRAQLSLSGGYAPPTNAPEKPSAIDKLLDRDKVREYEKWQERQELGLE